MAESEREGSGVFDLERIRTLIELMREHDIAEVDLREGEQRIRLARPAVTPAPAVYAVPPYAAAQAPAPPPAPVPAERSEGATAEGPHMVTIRSPMVGTFYSRPNPNSPPFVKVGDHVEAETTVCIVEAMKMFNEIPAEVRGRIVAVLVDDEEPVDHGKPLFRVDTSG
jgi:acetyl-CoA carboxylase biotin carboxyl carrier protein